jgi:Fe2+ or Zn2+ uptake regulation protein
MTKADLNAAVDAAKTETREALQTVYDALNQGQQKKIVKEEKVKKLFDLYSVKYGE